MRVMILFNQCGYKVTKKIRKEGVLRKKKSSAIRIFWFSGKWRPHSTRLAAPFDPFGGTIRPVRRQHSTRSVTASYRGPRGVG